MTARTFEVLPSVGPGPRNVRRLLIAAALFILLVIGAPITVVPARRASWTASEPTPPAAPATTTVSPGLRATARTAA